MKNSRKIDKCNFTCFPLWGKWLEERSDFETIEVVKVKGRKSDEVLFGDNDKKTARLPFSDRLTVSFLKTFIIRLWRNILFGYPPATKNFDFY